MGKAEEQVVFLFLFFWPHEQREKMQYRDLMHLVART